MSNEQVATDIPRPDGLVMAPFRALRYDASRVRLDQVLAPPYDVIDDRQRSELAARDPRNVVRLTLPRDEAEESGYEVAARTFAQWRGGGGGGRPPRARASPLAGGG